MKQREKCVQQVKRLINCAIPFQMCLLALEVSEWVKWSEVNGTFWYCKVQHVFRIPALLSATADQPARRTKYNFRKIEVHSQPESRLTSEERKQTSWIQWWYFGIEEALLHTWCLRRQWREMEHNVLRMNQIFLNNNWMRNEWSVQVIFMFWFRNFHAQRICSEYMRVASEQTNTSGARCSKHIEPKTKQRHSARITINNVSTENWKTNGKKCEYSAEWRVAQTEIHFVRSARTPQVRCDAIPYVSCLKCILAWFCFIKIDTKQIDSSSITLTCAQSALSLSLSVSVGDSSEKRFFVFVSIRERIQFVSKLWCGDPKNRATEFECVRSYV